MAYRESFYRFLMTQRNPGSADDIAQFANKKTMKNYQTI